MYEDFNMVRGSLIEMKELISHILEKIKDVCEDIVNQVINGDYPVSEGENEEVCNIVLNIRGDKPGVAPWDMEGVEGTLV